MMRKDNKTWRRILDASENLFSELGYTAVTLQDIAAAVDMRHASLYYYAPHGKEDLYIAVMERGFRHHGEGLAQAIADAGDDFRARVHAVAHWFATHPPIDLGRIVRSDMPHINPADATRLIEFSLETLRQPIAAVIREASAQGLVQADDPDFVAMALVGLLQSVHNVPERFLPTQAHRVQAAQACADMLIDGLRVR
ncbi:MAG: TetR/AcrR family transcriptional regulator [Pleurocapsa minor GSE-CHR-MK-17-07R]|jgi:AcrR family transcriptional regulator|nr:TetR/AcrR family transcriptional regulator [Pleurocapsa minor GSE-CHR-MK 17-07R]